ncbi:N2,N2-dimethylguanosine tRNA methyltransferase family protein [Tritrichomonas foetus]|uniref:tRNA (guanine(26)-N(2))-dimethyltransferase n=1 Tax=Tritrichomonas foetus TaxID=1144522 RepID=A0A1J4JRP5_9EUKA|nr:N2,N2-dimethylguanosine tRNA methyltransferase family protein [Tritrichomonas foetus]|eukprot:OHT01807.1 N2,N2-dimethylguanosine tRNA methyltransferase family protein [Tritrichomonas foetus]
MGSEVSLPSEQPVIEEGSAKIYFPSSVNPDDVFYNPVQVFNRDLTCLVLKVFTQEHSGPVKIFEAFSASGLRSIRYAHEVPGVTQIIANDLDPHAVAVIEKNISINKVQDIVKSSIGDANILLETKRKEFQVIDLDPYSTAAPFIDGAVQAISDGGLLCVTSTDGRSLCGTQPDTAFAWYNSMTLNTDFTHEVGIRTLLSTIITAASRYGRSVEPLLSLSANFYFRVFVKIHDNKGDSKVTAASTSLIFYSPDSGSFWLQPMGLLQKKGTSRSVKNTTLNIPYLNDPWTGGKLKIGGPIYSGPLHNKDFCQKLMLALPTMRYVKTNSRIEATLNTCMQEIEAPLYYCIDALCGIVKASCPSRALVVTVLTRLGYQCSLTHCKAGMLKTDAPPEVIWDIIRTWYFNEGKKLPENDPKARAILEGNMTTEIKLEIDENIKKQIKLDKKRCKFYENPTKNFGPKSAAGKKKKTPKENK